MTAFSHLSSLQTTELHALCRALGLEWGPLIGRCEWEIFPEGSLLSWVGLSGKAITTFLLLVSLSSF